MSERDLCYYELQGLTSGNDKQAFRNAETWAPEEDELKRHRNCTGDSAHDKCESEAAPDHTVNFSLITSASSDIDNGLFDPKRPDDSNECRCNSRDSINSAIMGTQ